MNTEKQTNGYDKSCVIAKVIFSIIIPLIQLIYLFTKNIELRETIALSILTFLALFIFLIKQDNEDRWDKLLRYLTPTIVFVVVLSRLLPNIIDSAEIIANFINAHISNEYVFYIELATILFCFYSIRTRTKALISIAKYIKNKLKKCFSN